MSLARTVHSVAVDIQQLIRLYRQLYNVPFEIQQLFLHLQETHNVLKDTETALTRGSPLGPNSDAIHRLLEYKDNLIDIELFLDPEQILPRSGPGSDAEGVKQWVISEDITSCGIYEGYLKEISDECKKLLSKVHSNIPAPPVVEKPSEASMLSNHLETILQVQQTLITSPLLNPLNSPSIPASRTSAPVSYLSLSGTTFATPIVPLADSGFTLANLPSSTSSKRKRKDKTLAELRVQEIIQQQYGQSLAAGKKRKRTSKPNYEKTPTFAPISTSPIPSHPPPQYPPISPVLSPREIPDDNPDWSLDDVRAALPDLVPKPTNKGKGRALNTNESPDSWETGSSIHTGSSANSIHSSAREGSIFSTSSTDRMYEDGACKVWYHSGGKALAQLSIAHIEVKRALVPSGACISVYARMSDSKIIRDDLWMSGLRTNASPFFEHVEVVNAMRQFQDSNIACVVKFGPNPADHPQYSFAAIQDGWDFVQHVTGKTLICSVNIASIKSACTHGNHVESGTDTIQVWEEEAEPGRMKSRTVKFFRNKNPSVVHQVVEFNCNALRPPEQDHRSGKVTFRFRDMRDGNVKDMRYIKIAFLNHEDKETFIHEVGLSGH